MASMPLVSNLDLKHTNWNFKTFQAWSFSFTWRSDKRVQVVATYLYLSKSKPYGGEQFGELMQISLVAIAPLH